MCLIKQDINKSPVRDNTLEGFSFANETKDLRRKRDRCLLLWKRDQTEAKVYFLTGKWSKAKKKTLHSIAAKTFKRVALFLIELNVVKAFGVTQRHAEISKKHFENNILGVN